MLSAVLVSCACLGFFICLYSLSYCLGSGGKVREEIFANKFNLLILILFVLAGFFFSVHIVSKNNGVYFWDYGGYWTTSYETMQALFASPFATLKDVYHTMLQEDYNKLLPLLISLPLRIFGYTFPRYVVLTYCLSLVPAWIIIATIVWKVLNGNHQKLRTLRFKYAIFAGTLLCIFTFNALFYPMFRGYIDVACLVPVALCVLLFVDYDCFRLDKKQILRDLLIAALLLTCFLFRRYFAFFVVGYVFALCLFSVYKPFSQRRTPDFKTKAKNSLLNLCVIGASSLAVLLVFFRPLVFKVLKSNYAGMYAAYDADLSGKIGEIFAKFSVIVIVLAVSAILLCFVSSKSRKVTLFCALSAFVSAFSLFRVQQMDDHHAYTIAIQLCILTILGIYQVVIFLKNRKSQVGFCALSAVFLVSGFLNCYVPSLRFLTSPASGLFSKTYEPFVRGDMEQLHELADRLNGLTKDTDKHAYVCASGIVLNESILRSLDRPYVSNAVNNLYDVSNVDLRDGFSVNFLKAEYVVVTDPTDLHLFKENQEVVSFLSEEIKEANSPVGKHFEKMDESFELDDGVVAHIYEKTSEFEQSDLQYIADFYTNAYPGHEDLFADRILTTQSK